MIENNSSIQYNICIVNRGIRLISQHPWDNERAVSKLPADIELIILHAKDDEVIPFAQSEVDEKIKI